MTNPNVPHAYVVGWPIRHSRSPLIHGHWLSTLGIEGAYDRLAVAPEDFPDFLKTIGQGGLRGANITVPHKEAAYALCDLRTDAATSIGAVNTIWIENGRLCGDNTDAAGFMASLDDEIPEWGAERRMAVVLGAGGAARAIVHALKSAGFAEVIVANRSPERARLLAEAFGSGVAGVSWEDGMARLRNADLLVNATSLGMVGQPSLAIDVSRLHAGAVVADIVYAPLLTPLALTAREHGLRAVGGLGMLLHQAVGGFERWFDRRPRVTAELRALVEADILQSAERPK